MTLVFIVLLLSGLVSALVPRRFRALVWIVLIVGGVVPWTDYQGHSHWARVGWWPFVSPPVRVRDIVVNLLLYAPLGWHLVATHRRTIWMAAVAGVLLSCVTELTQVYSHERFATTTDVVMNGLGTIAGAVAATRRRERASR